jgi:hypothetical protein
MTIRRSSARWYETLAATLSARADKLAAENAAARAKLANTKFISLREGMKEALQNILPGPDPVFDEDNLWMKWARHQKYTKDRSDDHG